MTNASESPIPEPTSKSEAATTATKPDPPETATSSGPDEADNGKKSAPKSKGGAPKNNRNALRSGLTSGFLPEGCSFIVKQTSTFRNALESALMETRGKLGLFEVASIQTCCEFHQHGLKVRRWLRVAPDLSSDQQVAYSREICRAFESRDKILKSLGLDETGRVDVIDALYSRVPAITDQSADDPTDSDD